MDINLSISAAPGITTDYLVAAIYEATAPATLVQSQGFAAPHTTPQNISFVNVLTPCLTSSLFTKIM
jgi:hypothetical protein